MVTYCATQLTATCSPMIGQFVDTMILASICKSWKVLETVSNHLKCTAEPHLITTLLRWPPHCYGFFTLAQIKVQSVILLFKELL